MNRWAGGAFLLSTALTQATTSAEQQLREIRSVLEARSQGRNPIWVKCRVEQFESAQSARLLTQRVPANAPGLADEVRDIQWTTLWEVARKGPLFRGSFVPVTRALFSPKEPMVNVFNGTRTVTRIGPDRYMVSKDPRAAVTFGSPWTVSGEDVFLRDLNRWATGAFKVARIIIEEEKDSAGRALLRVELHSPNGYLRKAWLSPEESYAIYRCQSWNPNGQLTGQSFADSYRMVDGVPYAESGTDEYYAVDEPGLVLRRTSFKLESIVTDASQIPDSLFDLPIPRDAQIYDEDLKMTLRDPAQVQAYLDRLARLLPPRPRPWRWMIGAAAALLSVLVALLIIARKYRRQAAG